jgi:hypothetical protein
MFLLLKSEISEAGSSEQKDKISFQNSGRNRAQVLVMLCEQ